MKAQWYVGIRKQPFLSTSLVDENTREAFTCPLDEVDDWWEEDDIGNPAFAIGGKYAFVIGPFKTKKGADWFASHKECRSVEEAERFAKMKRRNAS